MCVSKILRERDSSNSEHTSHTFSNVNHKTCMHTSTEKRYNQPTYAYTCCTLTHQSSRCSQWDFYRNITSQSARIEPCIMVALWLMYEEASLWTKIQLKGVQKNCKLVFVRIKLVGGAPTFLEKFTTVPDRQLQQHVSGRLGGSTATRVFISGQQQCHCHLRGWLQLQGHLQVNT